MNNPILSAGTTLKNHTYRIRRLLGQGGFGAVYLAEDLSRKTLCAIKESFDTSPRAQAQFATEATILMLLQHRALTPVTDHFVEPSGQQYLVMEYVEGQDLAELLDRRGPLPEKDVLVWMDQVLDAAAYLHAYKPRSVIHRDIKPDNIRLLPDGRTVRLVDFGIAKIGGAADRTRSAARGVTPGFSPPEQYGTGTDTFSDVYALGATLYNLLTNVVPPVSVDIAHSGAQLIPPRHLNPQISPQVEQVILTAMQISPALRFPNAGEMRKALQGQRPATITTTCPDCGTQVRPGAHFCPNCGRTMAMMPPFDFKQAGFQAHNVAELVRGCDTYWQEALGYFRHGEFDAWLAKLGPSGQQLAGQSKAIRARHSDPSAALEEFLEAAAPTRSLPMLTVNPTSLDFGPLRLGDSKVLALDLSNSGRGYLYGTIQASQPWIQAHPA
jgi:serine/threonine-protein kinase